MALTQFQLKSLRYDLQALARIEYTDVLTELLDHYASLTEQKMQTGLSFDDASKWAWAELGSGEGLQAIEEDYVRNIHQQVRTQHLDVLKSYFRWPAIVTTVLVGLLVYLIVPQVPTQWIIIGLFMLGISPSVVIYFGYRRSDDQPADSNKIVFDYMKKQSVLTTNLVNAGLNFGTAFFEESSRQTIFLQAHAGVAVFISLMMLLYLATFIKLYRQRFHYQPA